METWSICTPRQIQLLWMVSTGNPAGGPRQNRRSTSIEFLPIRFTLPCITHLNGPTHPHVLFFFLPYFFLGNSSGKKTKTKKRYSYRRSSDPADGIPILQTCKDSNSNVKYNPNQRCQLEHGSDQTIFSSISCSSTLLQSLRQELKERNMMGCTE